MAGRPRTARVRIVDNVLPANVLFELSFTTRELAATTANTLLCIEWLAKYGLLKNEWQCRFCVLAMSFQRRGGRDYRIDGYAWACPKCKRHFSIRKDSFFESSHLSLQQLLDACILVVSVVVCNRGKTAVQDIVVVDNGRLV